MGARVNGVEVSDTTGRKELAVGPIFVFEVRFEEGLVVVDLGYGAEAVLPTLTPTPEPDPTNA